MGIVLPDGILGNPDLEYVRAWILRHARVLASIDLPVEAFLPQVGVQASLVFLEKRPRADVAAGVDPDYPIMMAVAEHVGHDRRGNTVYRRDPDGFEIYRDEVEEMEVRRDGEDTIDRRTMRRRVIADDLPLISAAYRGGSRPTTFGWTHVGVSDVNSLHCARRWLAEESSRLDASCFASGGLEAREAIYRRRSCGLRSATVAETSFCRPASPAGSCEIASRGVPFLSSSDMLLADLAGSRFSRRADAACSRI